MFLIKKRFRLGFTFWLNGEIIKWDTISFPLQCRDWKAIFRNNEGWKGSDRRRWYWANFILTGNRLDAWRPDLHKNYAKIIHNSYDKSLEGDRRFVGRPKIARNYSWIIWDNCVDTYSKVVGGKTGLIQKKLRLFSLETKGSRLLRALLA